jgi:hypothetical protein
MNFNNHEEHQEYRHADQMARLAKERRENNIGAAMGALAIGIILLLGVAALVWGFYGLNHYWLWSARMTGKQELARAEGNRQIVILEAQAKKDSALSLAEAEIIRAEGLAKANKIIGDSLRQNESYLKYLWIQSLDKTNNKVIYVPTETNLPILEATRLTIDSAQ